LVDLNVAYQSTRTTRRPSTSPLPATTLHLADCTLYLLYRDDFLLSRTAARLDFKVESMLTIPLPETGWVDACAGEGRAQWT